MPRHARIDAPGLYQHIMVRGLNGQAIFCKSTDFQFFLESLPIAFERSPGTECYAWALMTNHVHLFIKTGRLGMAQMMKSLLTRYANYFNQEYDRTGYLFQNRYKSIVCDAEEYFLQLVRYIHLNPLKGKLVKNIDELDYYPYTGHASLMGNQKCLFQNYEDVLCHFGDSLEAYRSFIESGIDLYQDFEGGGLVRSYGGLKGLLGRPKKKKRMDYFDSRVLGKSAFVKQVLENYIPESDRIEPARKPKEQILKKVCQEQGVSVEAVKSNIRKKEIVEARYVFCFRCVYEQGYHAAEVAEWLGVSPSTVSVALSKKLSN